MFCEIRWMGFCIKRSGNIEKWLTFLKEDGLRKKLIRKYRSWANGRFGIRKNGQKLQKKGRKKGAEAEKTDLDSRQTARKTSRTDTDTDRQKEGKMKD